MMGKRGGVLVRETQEHAATRGDLSRLCVLDLFPEQAKLFEGAAKYRTVVVLVRVK